MIDISKMQLGDKVTVHGTILTIDRRRDRFGGAGIAIREQWFTPEKIITHTPAPREFKPGDRVVFDFIINDKMAGIILCIDNAVAWLKWPNGIRQECPISELCHADESE